MQRFQIAESRSGWSVIDQETGYAAQQPKGSRAANLSLMTAVDLADGLNEGEVRRRRRQAVH